MVIRLIHVGVGVRGRHWLDAVAQHPDFVSAACVDSDEHALSEIGGRFGLERGRLFHSLEDALSRTEADAALIASPTALHARHAFQALDAGLPVLLEKPMAADVTEAARLVERSRSVSRPLMVAENYRFFPAERTLRSLLDDGTAGRLACAVCVDRRDQPSNTQGAWVKGMDYPFLSEIAVHHFDSFRYLFKRRPSSMFSMSYNPSGSSYSGPAAMDALIELEGGFPIQYAGTLVGSRYEFTLWVQGDNGDLWTDRRRVWWRPRGRRFFRPVKSVAVPKGDELPYPRAGTVTLLNQFRDAVLRGAVPETSADDNIWTIAMVDASILSEREGRKVAVDEVFTPALKQQAGLPANPV